MCFGVRVFLTCCISSEKLYFYKKNAPFFWYFSILKLVVASLILYSPSLKDEWSDERTDRRMEG